MPQRKVIPLPIRSLDISAPAEYIDMQSQSACQNIEVERNVLRKRFGSIVIGSTQSEELMLIKELLRDATRYIVRIGLDEIHLLNESAGTWSDVTGSDLTGTTADAFSSATPLLSGSRILIFSNFVDNVRKYTGTGNTADLGGSPPKTKYMQEFGAYLVFAHVNDGSNRRIRVQWCDTDDIEDWSTGNSGYKDLYEDGDDITGMGLFGNYLAVHKEGSIYLGYIVGTSDIFQFERKNTGVGTICNNTIQFLNTGEQIFLARDGIRVFNGISALLIESPMNEEIRDSMNSEYIHKSWSIVIPEFDLYLLGMAIGSQTSPDTVYKFNYRTRQCYKDYMPNITCVGKYQRTANLSWQDDSGTWDEATDRWDDSTLLSSHKSVLFGDNAGLTTRRDSTYNNDNGTLVNAYTETKDFEAGEKGQLGRWQELQIWAKGGTLKVEYSTDAGATWTTVTTLTLSSDYPSDDGPLYVYHDVVSSKIRYRFSNAVSGETFYIKAYTLGWVTREMRR